MELHPTRVEIDHRTIKLLIGVIAIALPILVSWLAAPDRLTSVSASEVVASKIAAISGVLIPMFPCGCDGNTQIIPGVHYLAAAAILVLAFFCWHFLRRAWDKKNTGEGTCGGIRALRFGHPRVYCGPRAERIERPVLYSPPYVCLLVRDHRAGCVRHFLAHGESG